MRSALFLILAFCCSFASADVLTAQKLNEIRSNSNLYATSMMVYYNPKDLTPDERSLAGAFGAVVVLGTKIAQLGSPPAILSAYKEMESILKTLELTKRSQSAIFPENIKRILVLNKQIQTAVVELYAADPEASKTPLEMLFTQSDDISKLLFDYQLRRYPLEDADKVDYSMDPTLLPALDAKIESNFETLIKQYPANADYLEPAFKNYRFVRKQLLQSKGRPNGGAEFYMTRTVIDLNDLGATLAGGVDAETPQLR